MRTVAENVALFHRGRAPGAGLPSDDVMRALSWTEDVLGDLVKLHRNGDLHGAVCPEAIRVKAGGAKLEAPGVVVAAREYRDPERERRLVRESGAERERADARSDVFGAGATLYALLEGGPPPCGSASTFTKPVPSAVAYVVGRALTDGPARYPDVRSMRLDVERLRRLSRGRGLDAVEPSELPSWSGGSRKAPLPLVPFEVRERRAKRLRPFKWLGTGVLLAALLVIAARSDEPPAPPDPKPAVAAAKKAGVVKPRTLKDALAGFRARLDHALGAAGEAFDAFDVPLVLVSDVEMRGDLGWPLHPSRRLKAEVRAALAVSGSPGELQTRLIESMGEDTLPAVLEVTPGAQPGTVDIRLFYRTLVLTEKGV